MKRVFDVLVVALVIVPLSLSIIFISICVWMFMGYPILFTQIRSGKNCKPFRVYKFRTMTDDCDEEGRLLSDEKRLTKFGKVLRSTSLDEFPELFNVLKGEMSFVGPRPLLMQYLERYTPEQMRRHEMKPGITGWAQINGRNTISWEEKLKLDVWYVDHQSFFLDLKIILLTVWKIIRREGINQHGQATAEEFKGTI